jgi:hypothetical protein
MPRYTISVDLNEDIEADNEEEAYRKAKEYVEDGAYTLMIVDKED